MKVPNLVTQYNLRHCGAVIWGGDPEFGTQLNSKANELQESGEKGMMMVFVIVKAFQCSTKIHLTNITQEAQHLIAQTALHYTQETTHNTAHSKHSLG